MSCVLIKYNTIMLFCKQTKKKLLKLV